MEKAIDRGSPATPSEAPVLDPEAKTLADAVFRKIRADILLCKLAPGSKLRIGDLTSFYDVSGSSVREALCRLAAARLVNWQGQRGFRVAEMSVADLLDLTKNRIWVEIIAMRSAIRLGDRNWEAEILAASHRLGKQQPWRTQGKPDHIDESWVTSHRSFHTALVSACASPQLLSSREVLNDMCGRYRRVGGMKSPPDRDLASEHAALLDAVLGRDAERAQELVQDHFLRTVAFTLSTLGAKKAGVQGTIAELKAQISAGIAS